MEFPVVPNRSIILSYTQHTAVGVYVLSSGIFSGLLNVFVLFIYYKYRRTLIDPSAVFEIALLLSDLAVAGLHPFSGTAAIFNRWIWGPIGCQMYAVMGFIFGTFQLTVVPLIFFDRYIMCCKESFKKHRTIKLYMKAFIINFVHALVWALFPVIGWASYQVTPVQISCTIDWTRTDSSYITYITAYTLFGFVIPWLITVVLAWSVYKGIQRYKVKVDWSPRGHEGKMILVSMNIVYLAFGGYGFTCIYAIATNPFTMPPVVHIIPPVLAKMAGPIHVIVYCFLNPKILNCIKHYIGCPHDPTAIAEEHPPPPLEMTEGTSLEPLKA